MRYSKFLIPTLREDPAEAEVVSHKLMVRAGMIRRLALGIYSYLPLGLRSLRKIQNIIREELAKVGAQELLMPQVHPAELWKESGRWEEYGKELLRFTDRHNREYCLGPTHEEVATDIIRHYVRSYRDLPINIYHFEQKFRDEVRPRFGLMRSREFEMKDAYTFDVDNEAADKSYWSMYEAYKRIFARCGLKFTAVEADSGTIGGSFSHEFMVLADTGEDAIVNCPSCGYAANTEKAEVLTPAGEIADPAQGPPLTKVLTTGKATVEEVADFLKIKTGDVLKTLIYRTDDGPVAVLVPGDREVNEIKLKKMVSGTPELAEAELVKQVTGAPTGYAGPIGLSVRVLADRRVEFMNHCTCGANELDYHYTGAMIGRDFNPDEYADLTVIQPADPCPRCQGAIDLIRGIEVGHVFKLGTKYSKAMKATYLDADGKEQLIIMGCYGIGPWRTLAAAIEQNHDENGIIWPIPLTPFEVLVIPLQMQDEAVVAAAEKLYGELIDLGVEALLDDRDERAGIKFNDADLIGIPYRLTVSRKTLAKGQTEFKDRLSGEMELMNLTEAPERIKDMRDQQLVTV